MFWQQRPPRGRCESQESGAADGKYAIGGHPFVVSFFCSWEAFGSMGLAQSDLIVQCVRYPFGARRYIQRYRARETKASLLRAKLSSPSASRQR